MYTQCSKCETVFKLSAEVLRAAGGQVRCGKCGDVFNALARLTESAGSFETGESSLELETRADNILQAAHPLPGPTAPPPDRGDSPPAMDESDEIDDSHEVDELHDIDDSHDIDESLPEGVEIAQLQILDLNEDDFADIGSGDTSMEFTLPPGELDRIFVESKRQSLKPLPFPTPVDESIHGSLEKSVASGDEDKDEDEDQDDSSVDRVGRNARKGLGAGAGLAAGAGATAAAAALPLPLRAEVPLPDRRVTTGITGFEVPDNVRRQVIAGIEDDAQSARAVRMLARREGDLRLSDRGLSEQQRGARGSFILWLSAGVVAALVLLVQIVHHNRDAATGNTTLGSTLRHLLPSWGAAAAEPANLSAYQLRQWGVTGDPSASGVLRVRASILNTAAQLQPFPLLRVTLANRFGSRIGTRDFEPSEYLGKPTARLLAPGERVDATLDILDPGKNAEGFEIDVCLRQPDTTIACASDVAPQTKK